MPKGTALVEELEGEWNVGSLNATAVFASVMFMIAGLVFTLVAFLKHHGAGAVEDTLHNLSYSLIVEEKVMAAQS